MPPTVRRELPISPYVSCIVSEDMEDNKYQEGSSDKEGLGMGS